MSQRKDKRLADKAEGRMTNKETKRVWHEAQDNNTKVNGCQKGTEDIPDFTVVTDMTSGATFAVKIGEPLIDALGKARKRMTENHDDEAQSVKDW